MHETKMPAHDLVKSIVFNAKKSPAVGFKLLHQLL